ncbi:MAG: hypothetical protein Q4G00_16825 [Clostridia bacterium]|nr:hypothetical protein [Clostridia bacterium]
MPAAWVVIVILWWIISTVNKAKKAQANQGKQPARPVQSGGRKSARLQELEDTVNKNRAAQPAAAPSSPPPQPRQDQIGLPREAVHTARPLEAHMHTPVMGTEGNGNEGIDCCHEYMLSQPEQGEPADFLPLQDEEENERAKALLQGVIFSEILGRRPMKRYGGKHA